MMRRSWVIVVSSLVLVLACGLVLYDVPSTASVRVKHVVTMAVYKLWLTPEEAQSRTREAYMKSPYGGEFIRSVALELLATNYTLPHRNWPSVNAVPTYAKREHEQCRTVVYHRLKASKRVCDDLYYGKTRQMWTAIQLCDSYNTRDTRRTFDDCQSYLDRNYQPTAYTNHVCSSTMVEASELFVLRMLDSFRDEFARPILSAHQVPMVAASAYGFLTADGLHVAPYVYYDNYNSTLIPEDVDICAVQVHEGSTGMADGVRAMKMVQAPLETRLAWEAYEYFLAPPYRHTFGPLILCKSLTETRVTEHTRLPDPAEWAATSMVEFIEPSTWVGMAHIW